MGVTRTGLTRARRRAVRLRLALASWSRHGPIVARWPIHGPVSRNWGDKLNPYLIAQLSHRPVFHATEVSHRWARRVYEVVGSGLARMTTPNALAWGPGFLTRTETATIEGARIRAVRGYRTLDTLHRTGTLAESRPVGDPAMLLPLVYEPPPTPRAGKIGVIPHWREQSLPIFAEVAMDDRFDVLDITLGIEAFIDRLVQYDAVVSSSLHGTIAAHVYAVPATLITVSSRPLGDGFKCLDYFSTVGLDSRHVTRCESARAVKRAVDEAQVPETWPDFRALLRSCPFLDPARGASLSDAAETRWLRSTCYSAR